MSKNNINFINGRREININEIMKDNIINKKIRDDFLREKLNNIEMILMKINKKINVQQSDIKPEIAKESPILKKKDSVKSITK